MLRAFVFLFALISLPAKAQNNEALVLQLGGFPLLDPDELLTPSIHAELRERQATLAACCALDLVLVVQQQSLSGNLRDDLELLRSQIVRGGLWTPETVLLIYQSRPATVFVARNADTTGHASMLNSEALNNLALAPDGLEALGPFLAELENKMKAQMATAKAPLLTIEQSRALRHLALTGAAGLASLILLLGHRRATGLAAAAQQLDLLLEQPLLIFPFPGKALRRFHYSSSKGSADLLILLRRQGFCHRGWAFVLATLITAGTGLLFTIRPFFLFLDPSFLGLALGAVSLLILLLTPLGVWLTPASLRRQALRTWLVQQILRHKRPCLILLHQHRRLTLWQPTTLPLRSELLRVPAHRLAGEAAHGAAEQGLKIFVDQFERLSRTYLNQSHISP